MDEYRIRKTEEKKEQEKMKTKYCISPFTRRELVIILKKRTEKETICSKFFMSGVKI